LLLTNRTTEAYIPALICLLSEFKGFEVPVYLSRMVDKSNASYSLPCMIARSHMGQGIFHSASSFYQAVVLNTIMNIQSLAIEKVSTKLQSRVIKFRYFCPTTSDDAALMIDILPMDLDIKSKIIKSTKIKTNIEIESFFNNMCIDSLAKVYKIIKNIGKILIDYGILTSSYKNWISKTKLEFNSLYVSTNGFGSNDLKFLYSLIDPGTSGNFLEDYNNVLNSYYTATNSGVTRDITLIIPQVRYLSFCRQWKIRPDITGFTSEKTIISGLPRIVRKFSNDDDTRTENNLHFKLRQLTSINDIKYNDKSLIDNLVRSRFNMINRSRERSSYRSCLTYAKKFEIVNR
jgi:hypothetical protein